MCVIQLNHVLANLKRFWVCLKNFPTSNIQTLPKYGKIKETIVLNYQCLIINMNTLINQQSKFVKILSRT